MNKYSDLYNDTSIINSYVHHAQASNAFQSPQQNAKKYNFRLALWEFDDPQCLFSAEVNLSQI